jgi:tellurite resistance protein
MTAAKIRCTNDLKLSQVLLENPDIKRVIARIKRLEEKGEQPATRRQLLTTSVRLSRAMAAGLHAKADHCVERLGIETPLELYAYASPQFNAACFKPEEGRVFIMFSSSLLEAFADQELLFVMGHELGHHVYRHHEVPIGYVLRGRRPPPADLALDLFAWSRYAEVSADRAGAFCAEDLDSVARALFKLASGITSENVVTFKLDEFLSQVDDMLAFDDEPGQGAPMQDWFSTHPFSPLRVKALTFFHESSLMLAGGSDKPALEDKVQQLMSLMEPDYMQGKTDASRAMRDLFLAAAVVIADAYEGISDRERAALKRFLGKAYAVDALDSQRLREDLPRRITEARERNSLTQRMQVMRDICLIATTEKPVSDVELELLSEIATGLEVPDSFVSQCLDAPVELD